MAVTEYYFDIETEDKNPRRDKVIAAAYRKMSWGKPAGELVILSEWEVGEEFILKRLLDIGVLRRGFDFVPIGYNLNYDLIFLIRRSQLLGLLEWDADDVLDYFLDKPIIDLKPVCITMNDGNFRTTLGTFSSKIRRGAEIPKLYRNNNYDQIVSYIREEAAAFFDLYHAVREDLVSLGGRLKSSG